MPQFYDIAIRALNQTTGGIAAAQKAFNDFGKRVDDQLKDSLGRRSGLGQFTEILAGGGAIVALTLISRLVKETADSAAAFATGMREGKISAGALAQDLFRKIPVIGPAFEAGQSIRMALSAAFGGKEAQEEQDLEKLNKALEKNAKYQDALAVSINNRKAAELDIRRVMGDARFAARTAGYSDADKAREAAYREYQDKLYKGSQVAAMGGDVHGLAQALEDEYHTALERIQEEENKARDERDRAADAAMKADLERVNTRVAAESQARIDAENEFAIKSMQLRDSSLKGQLAVELELIKQNYDKRIDMAATAAEREALIRGERLAQIGARAAFAEDQARNMFDPSRSSVSAPWLRGGYRGDEVRESSRIQAQLLDALREIQKNTAKQVNETQQVQRAVRENGGVAA